MRAGTRTRQLTACLLSAALATAAVGSSPTRLVLFDDLPTGPQPMSEEEQRYLVFGEALFDYYSDRQFGALSGLRVNQARGLFNGDTARVSTPPPAAFLKADPYRHCRRHSPHNVS